MLSKYFFTALKKITAHAQNFSSTLYHFDFKYLLGGLSELKILVSVVRFRPGPPNSNDALFMQGIFLIKVNRCSHDKAHAFTYSVTIEIN